MQRKSTRAVARQPFLFHSIRRISAPEDAENQREVYTGHAPFESFLELPTDENVRDYLVDAEGKKRRRQTQVHRAMRETLENAPHNFAILNSGIVIVARGIEIDDKKKTAMLIRPSIINGSQTQGVLMDYLAEKRESDTNGFSPHVKYEIVVTEDDDLIAEISISRNFQNDVMTISIAGRRGQLEELEKAFRRSHRGARLKKSETDLSDDFVATEKLLQVVTALIPADLWPRATERESPNKVFTYSMKAKCLKEFQYVWNVVHGKVSKPETMSVENWNEEIARLKELYQFFLDVAGTAWELYLKWKEHPGFEGTRIRSIERDKGKIKDVPDGIIFPILASLSAFAVKRNGVWTVSPPDVFSDDVLIQAAVTAYKEIAHSNPWNMGKSKACYSYVNQITSIYRHLFPKNKSR